MFQATPASAATIRILRIMVRRDSHFSSGIAGLNDANSAFNRNRTDALSANVSTNYRRHNFIFGGDFRRQEFNEYGQQNPRGSFAFTGAATQAPGSASAGASTTTGSDLADFLLGIPDTSALSFGNPDKYLRQSVYDLYFTDDWRMLPQLTVNAGMRWDYGAPITELFGRLANLDVSPGFTSVAPVVGSNPKGSVTGTTYPSSLVRPDKHGFEPRIGISWRPIPASTLVVRRWVRNLRRHFSLSYRPLKAWRSRRHLRLV